MTVLQMLRYRNIWVCIAMSCFMVAWMVLGWVFLPLVYQKRCTVSRAVAS